MQEGGGSLCASLAALSVHPHTLAPSNSHFHSHSHRTLTAVSSTSAPPDAPPAPVVALPTFPPLPPSTPLTDCLRHFLAVQEQRALTYSAWQAAFRQYIAGKEESDLHAFTAHCQHTTASFQQLSLQVKLCIAQLQSTDNGQWAEQLQEVQRLEKEKLGLTVAMQEVTS